MNEDDLNNKLDLSKEEMSPKESDQSANKKPENGNEKK